jgi:hypothetical protein
MSAMPATRSERPVPRLSRAIRRLKDASRSRKGAPGNLSNSWSTFETAGGTKVMSNGPSPATRYAMLTSPLCAYRVPKSARS